MKQDVECDFHGVMALSLSCRSGDVIPHLLHRFWSSAPDNLLVSFGTGAHSSIGKRSAGGWYITVLLLVW